MSATVEAAARALHFRAATSRAAWIHAPRVACLDRIPIPEPGEREVCVRLEGSGVCGSSVPVWEGREWFSYPLEAGAPGHEGWGVIDAVGEGVHHLSVGDRVAALTYHAFAEHDLAAHVALVRLPPELGCADFPGEPLGCAMNIFARSDIRAEHTVAIIGIGFLG
ncbi:MAG: Alcohol dehydrogenase GroES domain protein, partial [Gemmatimonadetes bacterium]|nr:Alcohol dehydrogenase GroES domain protein [Gemmatimonadota bacterium]